MLIGNYKACMRIEPVDPLDKGTLACLKLEGYMHKGVSINWRKFSLGRGFKAVGHEKRYILT